MYCPSGLVSDHTFNTSTGWLYFVPGVGVQPVVVPLILADKLEQEGKFQVFVSESVGPAAEEFYTYILNHLVIFGRCNVTVIVVIGKFIQPGGRINSLVIIHFHNRSGIAHHVLVGIRGTFQPGEGHQFIFSSGTLMLKLLFHWNFSVFGRGSIELKLQPSVFHRGGQIGLYADKAGSSRQGDAPPVGCPSGCGYQAALNVILFFKKPSSKATSSLVVFSQLKDGLYNREGYREVLPP